MKIDKYPSWLVSLEVAEKLKEIGLRVSTPDYYVIEGKYSCFKTDFDVNFERMWKSNYNTHYNYVAIPNFIQVLTWFRLKGMFSTIDWVGKNQYVYKIVSLDSEFDVIKSDSYPVYNFCRDALVDKLIEIYKDKISK